MATEITQRHVVKTGTPKAVAAAGTAERLMAKDANGMGIVAYAVLIQAEATNSGNIFVGGSTVDSTNGIVLAPGYNIPYDAFIGHNVDLTEIWLDAASNGDGVRFCYLA